MLMLNLEKGCTFQASEKLTREAFVIDLSKRKWGSTNIRSIFVDENDRENMYSASETYFKNYKNIPTHVLPYYKGIRPKMSTISGRAYCLIIENPAKRFEISGSDAYKFARYIADRMPENVEDLSPEIVDRFLDVVDKEKGYDISALFIVATDLKKVKDMFGDHLEAANYIVIDRFMNPVDINAFYEVMDKIIVKK